MYHLPYSSSVREWSACAGGHSWSAHCGHAVDRAAFARTLYGNLEAMLTLHEQSGFEGVRPRFQKRFRMAGQAVQVRDLNGPELRGAAEGIDHDGALLVRCDDGRVERVLAGDVTLSAPSAETRR